ncbi:unnamed protein product [Phytophthora fragariaefolia]|uniref:Unnamed protein product n=1 Tax=Phytophthora fragariaefolia TaxID=1490495 RepID=A0A9W6XWR5_9STRA|nr:unnamed protein product [Phytophthora fragariaefolia]
MTRYQKKSRRKRVRFAGVRRDSSNEGLDEYDRRHDNSSNDNEAIQTSLDNSNEESQTLPTIPNAKDIDPVAVQNEPADFKQKQTSSARTLTGKRTSRTSVPTGVNGLRYTPADISVREHGAVAISMSITGFVFAKAMSNTDALRFAQPFEECVYRRFGAPSLIRHDRDPRFMSEVFQAFAEIMQSKSRATLSYRPQTNGQQERSVKTVIQSV